MLTAFMAVNGAPNYGAPPDFAELPIDLKKREFFEYLTPIIADVNASLARDRQRVQTIRAAFEHGVGPGWSDRRWLRKQSAKLDVPIDELETGAVLALLERRTGIVPASLVLAQAAIESGWGTSRFAIEGNNYFGQRCYEADCGIEPLDVGGTPGFGLARFGSVAKSVESYVLNLNTHPEYRAFRIRRQSLRDSGATVTGLALVGELAAYSERGSEYVAEVTNIIRSNELE
jgi:Bax protein